MVMERTNICENCGRQKSLNYSKHCRTCAPGFERGARNRRPSNDERDARIAKLYRNEHLTMAEIAKRYGLSVARIGQIIERELPGDKREWRSAFNREEFQLIWDSSTTLEDVAAKAGVSLDVVRSRQARLELGYKPTMRRHMMNLTDDAIVAMYEGGSSALEIANTFDMGTIGVYRALRRKGYEHRHRSYSGDAHHWSRTRR